MFAQIFTSAVLSYAVPGQADILPDIFGGLTYNSYLITPPRIYAEELAQLRGFFIARERTPFSDFTIHLIATTWDIYYPGYNYVRWRFDGLTGAYLSRRVGLPGSLYDYDIHQARDGSLWRVSILGSFFEVDPVSYEEIDDSRQEASKYGATTLDLPLVDRAQNLVVMKTNNELFQIGVYNFTTGALIRRISISGTPEVIIAEDERRCYVVSTNHMLNLVDYSTGQVLSTLRAPGYETGALGSKYAWDRFLRRLLVFTWRANATDGACLSTVAGYFPKPLAVGITKPIPLLPPRAGRTVPCLTRVYGDAGEAIPGMKIAPTIGGDADLTGAPPATDIEGEAIVSLACTAAGSATLDLMTSV
jgi:hypothetical protein